MSYKTRKHQVDAMARELFREFPEISKAARRRIREKLRCAASIGGFEERSRALAFVRGASFCGAADKAIISQSVENVLGYK